VSQDSSGESARREADYIMHKYLGLWVSVLNPEPMIGNFDLADWYCIYRQAIGVAAGWVAW
jgi:hypothetical protein